MCKIIMKSYRELRKTKGERIAARKIKLHRNWVNSDLASLSKNSWLILQSVVHVCIICLDRSDVTLLSQLSEILFIYAWFEVTLPCNIRTCLRDVIAMYAHELADQIIIKHIPPITARKTAQHKIRLIGIHTCAHTYVRTYIHTYIANKEAILYWPADAEGMYTNTLSTVFWYNYNTYNYVDPYKVGGMAAALVGTAYHTMYRYVATYNYIYT